MATFSLASLNQRQDPTPGFPVQSQHLTFAVSWASNERLHTNTKQYPNGFRPCMPVVAPFVTSFVVAAAVAVAGGAVAGGAAAVWWRWW